MFTALEDRGIQIVFLCHTGNTRPQPTTVQQAPHSTNTPARSGYNHSQSVATTSATQATQTTNSQHYIPIFSLPPAICPLISRTQPESVLLATSGNPATYHSNFKHFKKSKLTHAQSLAFKEPTNNNQLEAEATNQLITRPCSSRQPTSTTTRPTNSKSADTAPHSTNKPARS